MNETEIRKYAELMKELGLTGLEITEDNKIVRMERSVPVSLKETVYSGTVSEPAAPSADDSNDTISVKSPIVGVFYAAPADTASPYVAIGDSVKTGQILCLVEAMKLMNEITAEAGGVIAEICVNNGQIVEYGTELFRIKR